MNALNDTLSLQRGPINSLYASGPYWDATREKRLVIQYCVQSGQYQFYPRPVSIATGHYEPEWREVSGNGEVYSYSITRSGPGPFRSITPYVVAIIRLNEGVDILSNIVNLGSSSLEIGLRVKPYWLPLDDGRHLLMFEPDLMSEADLDANRLDQIRE